MGGAPATGSVTSSAFTAFEGTASQPWATPINTLGVPVLNQTLLAPMDTGPGDLPATSQLAGGDGVTAADAGHEGVSGGALMAVPSWRLGASAACMAVLDAENA